MPFLAKAFVFGAHIYRRVLPALAPDPLWSIARIITLPASCTPKTQKISNDEARNEKMSELNQCKPLEAGMSFPAKELHTAV